MLPETNNDAELNHDEGLIEFVAPEIDQLTIVKAPEQDIVERPTIIFSDELIPPFQLGITDSRIALNHLTMLQQAAIALLAQATREILIVSPDLEYDRFDNEAFCQAVSAFARSSRYTVTRILIADPKLAIEDGHRLIKLMRRLSSLIDIRQLHEQDIEHCQAVIIADNMGLLRCVNRDPWQGSLLPKGTPYAQQQRERFMEWWERGQEVSDFRELKI